MQRIIIPDDVQRILSQLEMHGFEAYIVGGCVRDSLLGNTPHDFDITTNAKPEETKNVFSQYKVIETGLKHGTLTVLLNGEQYEITTYRIDGEYEDNRHPSSVEFTSSLRNDLARRDFTMNAIAYNDKSGIADYFGGVLDLKNGIIRCVGEPDKRFNEDGLRIMRALRFAAVYGFAIENETASSIKRNKELLTNISAERIQVELNKLICGTGVRDIMTAYREIFTVIIPELAATFDFEQHSKYHKYDIYQHILHSVESAENELCIKLAMLLHDLGKPLCYTFYDGNGHFKGHAKYSVQMAEDILTRLKYSTEIKTRVIMLVQYHDIVLEDDKALIKRWLNKLGYEDFVRMVKVHIADDKAKLENAQNRIPKYESILKTAEQIVEDQACFSLKNLEIRGDDIISLGVTGKTVGYVLNQLLEMVIAEKCENNKDVLMREAKIIIANCSL